MFKVYYTVKVLTINKQNVNIWLSDIKRMNNQKLLRMLHRARYFTGRFSRKEPLWPEESA